ncbi:MAG TPA: hypothetical protein VEJ20_03490, partial [Candidatus Eremiobacteraceae bacterium]|nr:hypothetical protein [Candidatus Eremiobacteraceae bacterium]
MHHPQPPERAAKPRASALAVIATVAALCMALTPQVLAADISDIGFVDQSAIGNLPAFQSAKQQLNQYQSQLQTQFAAEIKGKSQ